MPSETNNPDIHLFASGCRIDPARIFPGQYQFLVPSDAEDVFIRSRTHVPARIYKQSDDKRELGFAFSEIILCGRRGEISLRFDSTLFPRGVYKPETGFRWTDGELLIPRSVIDLVRGDQILAEVHVAHTLPKYVIDESHPESPETRQQTEWLAREPLQHIGSSQRPSRYEGISFAANSNFLAVAAHHGQQIHLYHRRSDGLFESEPSQILTGGDEALDHPHDLACGHVGGLEVIAAVEKPGRIAVWSRRDPETAFQDPPSLRLRTDAPYGNHLNAISLVPGAEGHVAAAYLESGAVEFHDLASALTGAPKPPLHFRSPGVTVVDGIAFTSCGRWMALCMSGSHQVAIFRRAFSPDAPRAPIFDFRPVQTIRDPALVYPHSIAFWPRTDHLVVCNAGARFVHLFEASGEPDQREWSPFHVDRVNVCDEAVFKESNVKLAAEGGAKGVAIQGRELALCIPELGVKIYPLPQTDPASGT